MPQSDVIEIILALRNLSQFLSGTKQATEATAGVGQAAEKTGKQAGVSWKSIAKWGGAATAVYGATRFIKGAVSSTVDLAKSTMALQRQTNLDTKTASAWVQVLKERHISSQQFGRGLVTLSKQMLGMTSGSKSAAAGFAYLGISQEQVTKSSPNEMLMTVADRLSKLRDPTLKSAEAQKLLGRSGLALLPLLSKGSKGIQEQIAMQEKYHNTLDGKSIKDTMKLVEQQREMEAAFSGVKLQLGTALIPILTQVAGIFLKLIGLLEPLTKNTTLFEIAIGVLTAAFIAYKIAVIASTIASLGLDAAMLPIIGIVVGIVAGVALLTVGFYELWKHVGWFRDAMKATWQWIKANWPLLLAVIVGPFALAAVMVVKHWGAIKGAVTNAVNWVISEIKRLVAYVQNLPANLGRGIGGIAKSAVSSIPGAGLVKKGAGLLGSIIPHQAGGVVRRGETSLVGERGPELLSLPAGSQITPLGAGTGFDVVIPLYLDGREVARSVARVTADKLARR